MLLILEVNDRSHVFPFPCGSLPQFLSQLLIFDHLFGLVLLSLDLLLIDPLSFKNTEKGDKSKMDLPDEVSGKANDQRTCIDALALHGRNIIVNVLSERLDFKLEHWVIHCC